MALFGDTPRFHEDRHACNKSNNFLKSSTAAHVGPGSTYSVDAEDVRSGWKTNRSPKHQPMDSLSHRGDMRGDMYMNGILTKDGHILHKDTKKHTYPPTGQYDPIHTRTPASPRSRPGEETYMGSSSPRLQDCMLRNGVLVTSSPREKNSQRGLGPGSYFGGDEGTDVSSVGSGSLLKKSHNRRVSGGNEKGYNNRASPTTPRSKSAGRSRPTSANTSSSSYFRQYTTNNLKNPPSPILHTPPKQPGQDKYKSDINGPASQRQNNKDSPTNAPYIVSPKRGIPIGRVYN